MSQKRVALLFSGQGAQTVGMGRDLAAAFPVAAELFKQADEVLGYELSRIAWEGPETELTQTRHCQPALYVHGLACLAALRSVAGDFDVHACAGLSLGEFTAHAAAGTFSFETGLRLVAERGRFMQEACEASAGGMAAMIGGEESAVVQLAADCGVDVANYNSTGQIVLSGEVAKIEQAVGLAKERGIRMAKALNVAGAYHSRLMQPAGEKLGAALAKVAMQQPSCMVVCNVEANAVSTPGRIRETLQQQVTGSVRWTQSMERLVDSEKCTLFLELGPGGVLAGLLSRTRKGVPCISFADVASIQAAAAAIAGE
jgi:[acyl-carrier-protein] S-malonyltransferase